MDQRILKLETLREQDKQPRSNSAWGSSSHASPLSSRLSGYVPSTTLSESSEVILRLTSAWDKLTKHDIIEHD
eukprot:409994-Karenia_brevis.AAC.1